jgi:hypothetical protein
MRSLVERHEEAEQVVRDIRRGAAAAFRSFQQREPMPLLLALFQELAMQRLPRV